MNFKDRSSESAGEWGRRVAQGAAQGPAQDLEAGSSAGSDSFGEDAALDKVLRDFRVSVQAWSEAAYNRPRPAPAPAPRRTAWRKAATWALGSVLCAGVAGGGFLEYQHRQEQARIAAALEAQHQRQLAEQRAREAEEELAKVDSDVSREVPNAMEPLVQLMGDESQ